MFSLDSRVLVEFAMSRGFLPVLGYRVPVVLVSGVLDGFRGAYVPSQRVVYLDPNVADDVTVLHEIGHVIEDITGVPIDHSFVQVWAMQIHQLLTLISEEHNS